MPGSYVVDARSLLALCVTREKALCMVAEP